MRYVLLTWNPGSDDMEQYTPEEWLEAMVLPSSRAGRLRGTGGASGTNWKSIAAGDAACMFRQGVHGRGLVAVGAITGAPFVDRHWNPEKKGEAHYVHVEWHRAMSVNDMITVDELSQQVPDFDWNKVYSSGRLVDGEAAAQLGALLGHAQGGRSSPSGAEGQGHGNAEHNRLVELEAMAIVAAGYEEEGYTVTDVSAQNLGWDLDVRRGRKTLHVEVKGVTGSRPDFFLTPNEFRAARDQKGWLAVVITEIFGTGIEWCELSPADVVAAAVPSQYRVTG